MQIEGKVALITGGARMGEAVGQALARRGCRIALTWRRSRSAAQAVVNAIKAEEGQAIALRCDLSQPASIRQSIRRVHQEFGRLDIVVHLASIYESDGNSSPEEIWNRQLSANAQSAFLLTSAAAPVMRRTGGGRVILISDWTATSRRPRYRGFSTYYVSKSAVQAIAESMALELAPSILVNAIAPGPILPPRTISPREKLNVQKATPVGKWGGAVEIAKAVVFLIETEFVTGETIRVDGGRHLN